MATTIDLSGQRILVTGASRGIGAALARHLMDSGATVCLHYNRQKSAAEALLKGNTTNSCMAQADLADPAACTKLFYEAVMKMGGLDGLVNNAGVAYLSPIAAPDADWLEDWNRTMAVNLNAAAILSRLAILHFQDQRRHRWPNRAHRLARLLPRRHPRIPRLRCKQGGHGRTAPFDRKGIRQTANQKLPHRTGIRPHRHGPRLHGRIRRRLRPQRHRPAQTHRTRRPRTDGHIVNEWLGRSRDGVHDRCECWELCPLINNEQLIINNGNAGLQKALIINDITFGQQEFILCGLCEPFAVFAFQRG